MKANVRICYSFTTGLHGTKLHDNHIVIIDLKMCYLATESWLRLGGVTDSESVDVVSPAQVLKGSTIMQSLEFIATDFNYRTITIFYPT